MPTPCPTLRTSPIHMRSPATNVSPTLTLALTLTLTLTLRPPHACCMSPHANGVIAREHTSSIHMPSPASSPSTHGSASFTAAVQLAAARTCGVPRYTVRGTYRAPEAGRRASYARHGCGCGSLGLRVSKGEDCAVAVHRMQPAPTLRPSLARLAR